MLKSADIEYMFGVDMDIFKRSIKKRKDLTEKYPSTANTQDGRPQTPVDKSPEKSGSSFSTLIVFKVWRFWLTNESVKM